MQTQSQSYETSSAQPKFSLKMRAVLLIFNADPFLMEAASPHINIETDTIYWDKILKISFGPGYQAAVQWAYGCWADEASAHGDCFGSALSMSSHFKVAVLEALCMRWGLRG